MGQGTGTLRPAGQKTQVHMNWTSLDEFLYMGGYGLYVWGSYAATLVVMAVEAVLVRKRLQAAVGALGNSEASG